MLKPMKMLVIVKIRTKLLANLLATTLITLNILQRFQIATCVILNNDISYQHSPYAPKEDIIMLPDLDDECPMGYFHCNSTLQCIAQRLNCDDVVHCDDASDELNCVNKVDSHMWDKLVRKQPFGLNDDLQIGECIWPAQNLSCPCRGNEILCRFQQLSAIPLNLPQENIAMLDLSGNNFPHLTETFLDSLPMTETLVLKFCSITIMDPLAFKHLSLIPIRTLYLDENKIKTLSENLFPKGNNLKTLILSGNRISTLNSYDFMNLEQLLELDLRSNKLEAFEAGVFEPLINLEILYLNGNRIKNLHSGMFPMLNSLHTLSLANNKIKNMDPRIFSFPHLRYLYLAENMLEEIKDYSFCNLHFLQGLHLNDNHLHKFNLHSFDCVENLTSLLLNDNDFQSLDSRILQNLTKLEYIYFSWFHLCGAAMHVRVCEPHGDGISSTYHLLDNPILRGSVWVMALIAIVGNLLVLLGRYFHKTRSNVEHSLYLRHLAASDFLMGVYLSIIACADIKFRGKYIVYEENWRHSSMCAFSGFLSTFSCQSSTLLLTLVTWDRLMSVIRPLQVKDTGRKRVIFRLFVLWSLSFLLAAVPLFQFKYFGHNYYGTNGVCLSLHIHDPYAQGWEYSAGLFICINTFSLIFILISYLRMLKAIRHSGGGVRSTQSGRDGTVATRFAIIIFSDCMCWLPVIIVKLAALSGIPISPDLYAWLAVLVLPVNSALNPILYTLTTAAFKQQLRVYLPSCILCQPSSQTQMAFESALSTSLGHFSSMKSINSRKRCSQRRLSFI